jgi:hypothetical protein
MVEIILALIRVNPSTMSVKDKDGNLPLHSAIKNGDKIPKTVLKEMLDAFPGAAVAKDKDGNTPLHNACYYRDKDLGEIVKMLLQSDTQGKAVCTIGGDGNLPVDLVCERNKCGVLSVLIDANPECLHGGRKKVGSIFKWAIDRFNHSTPHAAVVQKICTNHPSMCEVELKGTDGKLPVHYICYNKDTQLRLLRLLCTAAPSTLAKKYKGKLPLRILYELPAERPLIDCCEDAYPEAHDIMFDHTVSSSGILMSERK